MTKPASAPIIKPQLRIQFEQINFKIDIQTLGKLRAYAEFIHSEQSYLIREALNYLFETDTSFQSFLASCSNRGKDPGVTRQESAPQS